MAEAALSADRNEEATFGTEIPHCLSQHQKCVIDMDPGSGLSESAQHYDEVEREFAKKQPSRD